MSDNFLDVKQVELKTNLGRTKIYDYIKDGTFRAYRIGSKTVFSERQINNWMAGIMSQEFTPELSNTNLARNKPLENRGRKAIDRINAEYFKDHFSKDQLENIVENINDKMVKKQLTQVIEYMSVK